jgi:hypothetical protein
MGLLTRLFHRHPAECVRVAQLLQTYLDAELDDPAVVEEIAAHLDACHDCGLEADVYRRLKASLACRDTTDEETLARLRAFVDDVCEG